MNCRYVLLIIMMVLFCAWQPSYAGFTVKKTGTVTTNATPVAKSYVMGYKPVPAPPDRPAYKAGTIGKLSLVFGLCGFIPLIGAFFSIAAIILGSIGLRKKEKHSLAGLILGMGTITLGIIITILIFASLS